MEVPGARDGREFFTLSKVTNTVGWRIGFMVGNKTLVNALARTVITIMAPSSPLQGGRGNCGSRKATSSAFAISPSSTSAVAMCWLKGCTKQAGWSRRPKASMQRLGEDPEQHGALGLLEFWQLLQDAACVSPGIGFGITGIPMRFGAYRKSRSYPPCHSVDQTDVSVPTGCCQHRQVSRRKPRITARNKETQQQNAWSRWLPFFDPYCA